MLLDKLKDVIKAEVVSYLKSDELADDINGKIDVPGLDEALEAEVIKKVLGAAADKIDEL